MALKDALLAEYDHEMAATRKLLERIPDDKLTWKPHDKSRSLGALGQHLAHLPNWGALILERFKVDLVDVPSFGDEPASRTAILSAFDDSRAKTRKLLDKTDAERLATAWDVETSGKVFAMSAAAISLGPAGFTSVLETWLRRPKSACRTSNAARVFE